jgi:hypothetical protein
MFSGLGQYLADISFQSGRGAIVLTRSVEIDRPPLVSREEKLSRSLDSVLSVETLKVKALRKDQPWTAVRLISQ